MGERGKGARKKTDEELWTTRQAKVNFLITNEKAAFIRYKKAEGVKPAVLFDQLVDNSKLFKAWQKESGKECLDKFIESRIGKHEFGI